MNPMRLILATLALLLLTSCASLYVHDKQISQVTPGMSCDDAPSILGDPANVNRSRVQGQVRDQWVDHHLSGKRVYVYAVGDAGGCRITAVQS